MCASFHTLLNNFYNSKVTNNTRRHVYAEAEHIAENTGLPYQSNQSNGHCVGNFKVLQSYWQCEKIIGERGRGGKKNPPENGFMCTWLLIFESTDHSDTQHSVTRHQSKSPNNRHGIY